MSSGADDQALSEQSPSQWSSEPPALGAAFEEGTRLFDAGRWWEAHEAWEGPWLTATGHGRDFLQALILLAAALHKRWHHGSLTHRNFHKAAVYLDRLPAEYAGINLVRLRSEVWAALHDGALRPQVRAGTPPA